MSSKVSTYKHKYSSSVHTLIKQYHLKVKYVPSSKMFGYSGMNSEAGKIFGFKPVVPSDTILVDENLRGLERLKTIKHEVIEYLLIKNDGLCYWDAHELASEAEHE